MRFFHPQDNGRDYIDTIEKLETKLTFGIKDRDQIYSLSNL